MIPQHLGYGFRNSISGAGIVIQRRIMAKKIREQLRRLNPFSRSGREKEMPQPLPPDPNQRLVRVYVEGYEDVAFWRGIFDHFRNPYLRFEISVPDRGDLPKGKKVLLSMLPRSSEELLLCMDSDFDYLFAGRTPQSQEVNNSKFLFHTLCVMSRILFDMRISFPWCFFFHYNI